MDHGWGRARCIHVRPEGTDGATLNDSLDAGGRFAAAPNTPVMTFGRNNYENNYAIIIGVNTQWGWRFYGQTSTDTFNTISAAWRIFPHPMTRL